MNWQRASPSSESQQPDDLFSSIDAILTELAQQPVSLAMTVQPEATMAWVEAKTEEATTTPPPLPKSGSSRPRKRAAISMPSRPQTTDLNGNRSAASTVLEETTATAVVGHVQSTQRLNKEMARAVVNIVVEQLTMMTNLVHINKLGMLAAIADAETLSTAGALWCSVVQRLICAQVLREAEQRNLFPITVNTLSALLCETVSLYR